MRRIPPALRAGLVAFAVVAIVSRLRPSPYDNYVLLAQAFLHGRVWIDWPGAYIDALALGTRHYVIEAPLPAVLLLPAVAIFGGANQTLLSALLAAIGVGATWRLGERFEISPANNAWICAFALAGTDLLWCAIFGDVWFLAHVSAFCFTMLALAECAGKRRSYLVALWGACAFESRFSLVLVLPVYLYLCAADPQRPWVLDARVRRAAASFVAVLVPVAALWTLYNYSRWGTWNDIGYTMWYHQDQAGYPTGSPFRLEYLPYQLTSFFLQPPTWLGGFPYLRPEYAGVALTWTSPALLLAVLARAPARWIASLWIALALAAAPNFLYYVNGFAQFGMRHALDFEPFAIGLMILAMRGRFSRLWYALIAYSIVVGLWGCWYWLTFVRA